MKTANSDDRIFGTLALVLFTAGLLVPFVLDALFGAQLASAFTVIALALSLVFGLIARGQKTAKVALGGLAALAVVAACAGVAVSVKRSARVRETQARKHVAHTTSPVLAEQAESTVPVKAAPSASSSVR